MRILNKIAIGVVALLAVAAFAPTADAACGGGYILSSIESAAAGEYSYIWTDGQSCGGSYCTASAMTPARNGFF